MQVLGDQLVEVRAAEPIRAYASYTSTTQRLTVLLLNKDTVEHPVDLRMDKYRARSKAESWVFTGNGPTTPVRPGPDSQTSMWMGLVSLRVSRLSR